MRCWKFRWGNGIAAEPLCTDDRAGRPYRSKASHEVGRDTRPRVSGWAQFSPIGTIVQLGSVMGLVFWCVGTIAQAAKPGLPEALPLDSPQALKPLVEAAKDARLVLLGESSHGTAEFYDWRSEITRQLIESDPNFRFVAVEGDWCSLAPLNAYVLHKENAPASAEAALLEIDRWPLWMWANQEVARLGEWLRSHNADLPPEQRVGIYGMDIYGFWNSIDAVREFYEEHVPGSAAEAEALMENFARFRGQNQQYVQAMDRFETPAAESLEALAGKLGKRFREAPEEERRKIFDAYQQARVIEAGEGHLRGMATPGPDSWNARATAFMDTVDRLFEFYGSESRGIAWAHNTHIGDAAATDMAARRQVNIGHLARQRLGRENTFAVGFGTARGGVVAASEWEGTREVMTIPNPRTGSWEDFLDRTFEDPTLLLLDEPTVASLREHGVSDRSRIPHRAIGVIYHPEREAMGNYVGTILPERYDAFLFFPETNPVTPLHP